MLEASGNSERNSKPGKLTCRTRVRQIALRLITHLLRILLFPKAHALSVTQIHLTAKSNAGN